MPETLLKSSLECNFLFTSDVTLKNIVSVSFYRDEKRHENLSNENIACVIKNIFYNQARFNTLDSWR